MSTAFAKSEASSLLSAPAESSSDNIIALRRFARTIRRSGWIPFETACRVRYAMRKFVWGGNAPSTYLQKINWRLAYDRRPVLTLLADKVRVRDFIAERVGAQYLPRCFHVTDNPETIDLAALPAEFVIKPNHGCGMVWFVTDRMPARGPNRDPFQVVFTPKHELDRPALMRRCREWMAIDYSQVNYEWAYRNIPRRILVEEYLCDDTSGAPAFDYKLIVINGVVRAIQVDSLRFGSHRRGYFSRDWKKLPVRYVKPPLAVELAAPEKLNEMIAVAEALGSGLDHVRVDMYVLPNRIAVGELTIYHNAGCSSYDPPSFDFELGHDWKLPMPQIA